MNNNISSKKGNSSSEKYLDIDVILEELNISTAQTIIDLGCGNGYMSKEFSKLVGERGKIYAIDINDSVIDNLIQESKDTNIEAMLANITIGLPLKNASIDIIFLSTVFHIFSNKQIVKFQEEIKRLLKPEGILAILNIDKKEMTYGPPFKMKVSVEELRQVIKLTPISYVKLGDDFYMQIFKNE